MDEKEYLSIKYKIYLKNDETSLMSPATSDRKTSEQQQRSVQIKSAQLDFDRRDEKTDAQQLRQLKNGTVSPELSSSSGRNTLPMRAYSDFVRSSNKSSPIDYLEGLQSAKSSQTDYLEDPCINCGNLITRAAEFLTKIELNYGVRSQRAQPSSNADTFERSSSIITEPSPRRMKRFNRRKKGRDELDTSVPNSVCNKEVPLSSPVIATFIKRKGKSNHGANSIPPPTKNSEDVIFQRVSSTEDAVTPLDWMLSSSPSKGTSEAVVQTIGSKNPDVKKKVEPDNKMKKAEPKITAGSRIVQVKQPDKKASNEKVLNKPGTAISHLTVEEKAEADETNRTAPASTSKDVKSDEKKEVKDKESHQLWNKNVKK